MKVFFDHQCYWEKYGGVSRYFTEILKTDIIGAEYELALKYSNNEYLTELDVKYKHIFEKLNIPKKQYLISNFNKPNSVSKLNKTGAKIVHITHYDPYLFKYKNNKTIISTIYDLNFFTIPQYFRRNFNILKSWQTECVKQSDFLITISENSKNDLIKYFNFDEKRIKVIHLGVNEQFKKSNEDRLIKVPYILFVGRRNGYKNFETLLKSYINLGKSDIALVCTGASFSKTEMDMFDKLGYSNKIIHVNANEEQLVNLYSNAICFIFPSLYEGFGLPLLEAMGCECPVLCSNSSCFPEIAGDAAVYFDSKSVNDCTEKLEEIIKNTSLRESLKTKGLIRKKNFSWDITRKEHFDLYKKLYEAMS